MVDSFSYAWKGDHLIFYNFRLFIHNYTEFFAPRGTKMGKSMWIWAVCLLFSVPCGLVLAAELQVRYPFVQHPYYTKRDVYYIKLLTLALDRSGEAYQLTGVPLPDYSEKRSVILIQTGQYDVHWLNTTPEREKELLPVRIPLEKGAIGWRVFFIRPEMQALFNRIHTAADFKPYLLVQGHDWADVPILLHNGFAVERSSNWQGLFKMVTLNRAQGFPRSIIEILAEQNEDVAKSLVIEQNLILRYPAAYYFFVANDNQRLKNALERGLKNSIQDGSFDRLYFAAFGEPLSHLNLAQRRVISIDNPDIATDDESLWFSIDWFERTRQKFINPE